MHRRQVSCRGFTTTGCMIALSIILAVQIVASYTVTVSEVLPANPGFSTLPRLLGNWTMVEETALQASVEQYLQPDDYTIRTYRNGSAASDVSVFVAFFNSLQTKYGPHSPRACLPGSGWLTRFRKVVVMEVPGEREGIHVNQYVLEKSGEHILVLYWYQNKRRVWAEEFQAKIHLLPDLLRYRRSDVSLVRIIKPLGKEGFSEEAWKQTTEFARELYPVLVERLAKAG
jgi:EpsI family protein